MHKNISDKGGVNVDLDLLDLIYEGYTYHCTNYEDDKKLKEVNNFRQNYIRPLFEKDSKTGREMEEMFNGALAEYDEYAFKNGFSTCLHFMTEYFKGNL